MRGISRRGIPTLPPGSYLLVALNYFFKCSLRGIMRGVSADAPDCRRFEATGLSRLEWARLNWVVECSLWTFFIGYIARAASSSN